MIRRALWTVIATVVAAGGLMLASGTPDALACAGPPSIPGAVWCAPAP